METKRLNSNHALNMNLVQNDTKAKMAIEEIGQELQRTPHNPYIAVDGEGLTRGTPMSLIQLCVNDKIYLFDLQYVNPLKIGLDYILEHPNVIKVFHDYCEDASAIFNNYGFSGRPVFDTQIAHRLIHEAFNEKNNEGDYSQTSVSLNALLETYLQVVNDKKDLIQQEMGKDKHFWNKRPLTPEMVEYAAKDVQYLNRLCATLWNKLEASGRSLSHQDI